MPYQPYPLSFETCQVCKRFAYHVPLIEGICLCCIPDERKELVERMFKTEKEGVLYSRQEYFQALHYLWGQLNPGLS